MSYRMHVINSTMRIGRAAGGLDIEMTFPPHSFLSGRPVDEAYVTTLWIPEDHIADLREWLARNT